MSACSLEVVVDHVSDLSSAKEPIFFLGFLFLETDFLFALGILDDLVQSRRNPRIQHLKIRENEYNPELFAMFLNHPLNQPSPLLWSITLPPKENQNKHLLGF